MSCRHFGKCGSCSLHDRSYPAQLAWKMGRLSALLEPFYKGPLTPYPSPPEHYRARAEYKIFHDGSGLHYAMRHLDKRGFVLLEECPMVSPAIAERMWRLLEASNADEELGHRLFGVEYLSTTTGEVLVTMLYHKRLESAWEVRAKRLASELDVKIVGRSRRQKVVLGGEYVTERLSVGGRDFLYRHYEQSFTQPNPSVNTLMIEWAMAQARNYGRGDFCELYAGAGNFTIPLSTLFERVIATEISKRSIQAAKENCALNGIGNVAFVRMSSEEFTEALGGKREFTRLRGIDLAGYDLQTVLVDPPRAGLDEETRALVCSFETIIYISCNPETLARDLATISRTHRLVGAALFDQFPHTPHMEAGTVLVKR